ncbi:MAG: V-type ATP synthase subunit E family protein [Methanocalculus sp.]|uniref:V-type ATP synthase subunit E n=1 Tax=Methanocalculus sp. TaxID=2004547 RepID=UPI002720A98A|nr:V-type ATP synthase subunit E family protein [Methanocalculus sp.]MDO9539001.1 V-type ATP synthase subunit E family protein [Methanocalculus sp.]
MTKELIQAVEESAQEEIRSIREHAAAQVIRIKEEARSEGGKLKIKHPEYWKSIAAAQRTTIVAAREKAKLKLLQIKEEIFEETFRHAEEELAGFRDSSRYEGFLNYVILEALAELDGASAVLRVDKRDVALCTSILRTLSQSHAVIADIESMGGVIASTTDESVIVKNTIESRLKRSREVLRKEIFSILDGG